jgi:hypothetical protein
MSESFLGKPYEYWLEVQRRIDEINVEHLLDALIVANAKAAYYERLLDQAAEYRNRVDTFGKKK